MTTIDGPATLTAPAGAVAPEPELEPAPAPILEIVVPVYNEAHVLATSIERLVAFLRADMPFTWRITVVDNGSTDSTMLVADRLAATEPRLRVRHLDRKGRGLALRTAWSESDAAVLAYMDVDLSTGLDALLPLVAPLVTGHSDVAIGSRLADGASVARGPKRELISRTYNLLLHTVFATHFRDAQCGFKAVRRDAAAALLPQIDDDGWFFDTELLLLAEHNGLRIHELPVDWTDDPDSRVRVVQTARDDLAGVARMAWRFLRGGGRIAGVRDERPPHRMGRQLVVFGIIGALSTALSAAMFLVLRGPFGSIGADVVAVTATVVVNAWANRRFTFGRRGRLGRSTHYLRAGAVYVVGLIVATAALVAVDATGGGSVAEFVAVLAAWSATAVVRYRVLGREVSR